MTDSIAYRPLTLDECERIGEIDASQYIGRAWREVDGVRRLIDIDYLDPDFPEGFTYISRESRRKGIGKALFLRIAAEARERACHRLLICAGSAEETIAFYRALGCAGAADISPALYEADPRDMQLEFTL